MESDSQIAKYQEDEVKGYTVKVLWLVQIAFVMVSLILSGTVFIGNFVYMIEGWIGLSFTIPEFLTAWTFQSLIILILALFLLRANQGVMGPGVGNGQGFFGRNR
ncbi:MAG: hypothetical protein ACFFCX_17550, partial [Candidatus Sifarchaeia archaeon]